MSFEIPKKVEELKNDLVRNFADEVVNVTCNNCGSKTVMNRSYVSLVPNGIDSCSKCRQF